jgi:hypothetical protein
VNTVMNLRVTLNVRKCLTSRAIGGLRRRTQLGANVWYVSFPFFFFFNFKLFFKNPEGGREQMPAAGAHDLDVPV